MRYPPTLERLIERLKKLPGVGTRSAERFAFQLVGWTEEELHEFSVSLKDIPLKLAQCLDCGALIEQLCPLCENKNRNFKQLCIVATYKDIFAIESTNEYRGLYHVLGALLSPLDKRGPEKLGTAKIKERIQKLECEELLFALDATLEGDATALFLKKELEPLNIKISRLAFGVPMGSSLDYVDNGTLARALISRNQF